MTATCTVILVRVAVLCACTVSFCYAGGTLVKPKLDSALCDQLIPPGMEGTPPQNSFSLYATLFHWIKGGDTLMVFVVGSSLYEVRGILMQGRSNQQLVGMFLFNDLKGTTLDCPPYVANTWYYMNFTSPATTIHAFWMPPQNYLGRNLTMHTTIIRDNHTYFQYVDAIPPNRGLTTSTTSPTTFTTTTEKVISISGEEEPTGQPDVPTTGGG